MIHQPTPNETYNVELISNNEDSRVHKITGHDETGKQGCDE